MDFLKDAIDTEAWRNRTSDGYSDERRAKIISAMKNMVDVHEMGAIPMDGDELIIGRMENRVAFKWYSSWMAVFRDRFTGEKVAEKELCADEPDRVEIQEVIEELGLIERRLDVAIHPHHVWCGFDLPYPTSVIPRYVFDDHDPADYELRVQPAIGEAWAATGLDKATFFRTTSPKEIEEAAMKFATCSPMTVRELGLFVDNYTVGEYPCTDMAATKILQEMCDVHTGQDAPAKLRKAAAKGGCTQAWLTFQGDGGKAIGHIITKQRVCGASVQLPALVLDSKPKKG